MEAAEAGRASLAGQPDTGLTLTLSSGEHAVSDFLIWRNTPRCFRALREGGFPSTRACALNLLSLHRLEKIDLVLSCGPAVSRATGHVGLGSIRASEV